MKHRNKRLLSLLLTFAMVFSMLPVGTMQAKAAGGAIELGAPTKTAENTFKLSNATITPDGITALQVNVTGGTVAGTATGWTALTNIDNDSLTLYGTAKSGTEASAVLKGLTFTMTDTSMKVDVTATTKVTTITAGTGSTITKGDVTGYENHYYMFVPTKTEGNPPMSWYNAYKAAKKNTFMGMRGYLATITSEEEDKLLKKISGSGAWSAGASLAKDVTFDQDTLKLGGTELVEYGAGNSTASPALQATDGFRWACGPEAGTLYYASRGGTLANVNTSGSYTNWDRSNSAYPEPSGTAGSADAGDECCMQVNYNYKWNDLTPMQTSSASLKGYFVEFGGYPSNTDPGYTESSSMADYSATGTFTAESLNTKTVTITLGNHMTSSGGALTQTVSGAITTITIQANPGYTLPATATIGNGVSYTRDADPTKATISGTPSAAVTATVPDATANTFTVKYHSNNGTGNMTDSSHTYGITSNLTANAFTRTGYNFSGWRPAADSGVYYVDKADATTLTATNNDVVNLYAQWTIKSYNLNLTPTHATVTGNSNTTPYDYNEAVDVKLSANTGYLLPATLSGDNLGAAGLTYTPSADKKTATITGKITKAATATITATPITYSVKYDSNAPAGYTASGSTANTADCKYGTPKALANNGFTVNGFTFAGWFEAPTGGSAITQANNLTETDGAEVTLYAQWTRNVYTVEITAGEHMTVENGAQGNVDFDTAITEITVKANPGYVLPKNFVVGNGLTYTRTTLATATITGKLQDSVTKTITAATPLPVPTVEPGGGGLGMQIKITPKPAEGEYTTKITIGAASPAIEVLAFPCDLTEAMIAELKIHPKVTVELSEVDGSNKITATMPMDVTAIKNATLNTQSSGKAVAIGGNISIEGGAQTVTQATYYSVTPSAATTYDPAYVTTAPAFTKGSTKLTAAAIAGAYFDGFYVGGVKVTGDNVVEKLGAGASINGNVLTYTPDGTDKEITATYRNLLGEVNVGTVNDIKAVLEDTGFDTAFTTGSSALLLFKALAPATQAQALNMLDKITPVAPGYATAAAFVTDLGNVAGLFAVVNTGTGLDEGDYTEGTWAEFDKANKDAKALLNDAAITTEKITDVKTALETAISALQFKTLTLLIKADDSWIAKINTTVSATKSAGRLAPAPNAMSSRAYFPAIGTDATIKIAKAHLHKDDVFAATVNGNYSLVFRDGTGGDTDYLVATVPNIQANTTVVFTFNTKKVDLVIPTITGTKITTGGTDGGTDVGGKTITVGLEKPLVITVTPEPGKMIYPGTKIKVTIGGVEKEYPIDPDGTIDIPGEEVKGKLVIDKGSLLTAVTDVTPEVVGLLITDIENNYKNKHQEYTPETISELNKAIETAKALVAQTPAPAVTKLEDAYKAVVSAEKGLKKQFALTLTGTNVAPTVDKAFKPADWDTNYKDTYGAGTKAEFVAPGITKVTTTGTPGTVKYFVQDGYSVKMTGTPTAATQVVTSVAYTVGSNNGTSVAENIGGKFTFTIPSVNAATTVNTVNEEGKTIVITPLPITGPGTLNPGKITTGGPGEMTVDPGTGGKVTELIVDKKVITLPTEELIGKIREAIKDVTEEKTIKVEYPTGKMIDVTVTVGTPANTNVGTIVDPNGREVKVTVSTNTTPKKTTAITVSPKTSEPADTFEEITIDPDTGKAKVTFPDVDTGTHEVGGKIDHKTHPLPTGEIDIGVAPDKNVIGTITSKNEPALPGIDPGKGIENRDVVVTIEPKAPSGVITGGGIKYVVTDPLTGVETETTIILPGNATTGTAVVDPNTGVITVTIPAVKVIGEITFPELGKNIVDLNTDIIDKLLEVAKEVLKSKDKGTFEPAAPADDKWNAIDVTKTDSAANAAKGLLDEILAGTSKTDEEKTIAIKNLENAIEAITDTRNDVSTIPTGGSGGATPDVGTGITNPGTITTPVTGGGAGGDDNKLIMSPTTDDLIITGITTEPGYVPDKVIVTVIDPTTGVGTEVEIPLTGGEGGNLTGTAPNYTATIPGTNPATANPDVPGGTNLKTILEKLKPGDITGIKVVGIKDGNVILPTAEAIKTASNVLTGNSNDNASGTSAGVEAITLNPDTGVIAPKVGLTITATLGKDDYSKTGVTTALNRTYEFAGIKVNGKVIKEVTDYTVDYTTVPGQATVTFTPAQVKAIAGDGKAIGKIEILTTPTNPQYKTFVNDFAKLDELYKNYIKPTATPLEKVTFEELVAKLNSQLTETDTANLKKSEQLTADNKKHLTEEKAQITTFTETIKSKDKAEKLAVSIDEMYAKLKAEVIGAGGALPVGTAVSPSVAAAILANETAIETAKNEFDALSPVEKDQISIDTQKKLQNAIDALAAAIKATKTPSEIAKELIGALPSTADVLKTPATPSDGLKNKTAGGSEDANHKYGINEGLVSTHAVNKAALAELETLNKMLAAAEKAAQAEGATITVADRTKLDDLRTAIEKEYRDYAQLFTNENMADKTGTDDDTIAIGSTYPNDKITNWVTYPNTLIKSKGEYDKLPAKVKEAIDLKTAPENITDIFKEVFPNVNGLVGVTAESILAELVKNGTTTPVSYILTADLDNTKPVRPSDLTGAEWAEKVVKAYEKFAKLPTAEQNKVNDALTEGNKMADLYKKSSAISPNSEESKNKANTFIADHLTEYGNIITAVTDSNKALVVGGESDWSKLSFGAQKAVNEKLKALGSKTYPQLLSEAKALMPSTGGGDYDGGSTGGSVNVSIDPGKTGGKITVSPSNPKPGQEVTITVTVDPGYEIGTLLITDKKGKELPKLGNNPYIIIVPEGGFNIKGEFVKAGEGKHIGPFKDVPTDKWYAPAIEYVYNNKLFEGMSAEAFEPNSTMTRGMFVTVLGRLAKVDVSKWQKASKFPDVASDKYYSAYVAWGESQGILLGYGNGNYGPNDLVTREQMAAILYRYVKLNGDGYVGAWVYLLPYSDVEDISGYAFEGISWCTQNQIMAGKGNNTLEPKGNASRAEVAQLLYNFCNMKKK